MDRFHRQDGGDLLARAVAPGVALGGCIIGGGFALRGPLDEVARSEESINKDLAADRTGSWNTITQVWSHVGNTEFVIGMCVLVVAILLWRTRDWRLAAVPALAIAMQGLIFLIAAKVVDRDRPPVEKLDPSPPTASYPSGHVGASTGLYVAFALLALMIRRSWLRTLTIIACLTMPLLVAFARVYRGMHHLSDITAGLLNGAVCALLAYAWYRHRARSGRTIGGRSGSAILSPGRA
ncbi:phosphatase PAP2 family protein [Kribbella sp. CA-293567]|uniref:phosphatase PAP2 family protein n=1 Tax=Kribbella sp. CA-293567 TaxID=3002436 RepID=UPI0022DCF609|nr:phosphatase PAP2 family protein [Kribbella sp. CA-293567]WBQ05072.1 phosphatase PAP2 family protein [Kribbella sp. CA-293567]